jgi:hypothetical protein
LNAGTKKQNDSVKTWKSLTEKEISNTVLDSHLSNYDKKCAILKANNLYEDNGYTYGSAWLVEILPTEIIEEIQQLSNKFPNFYR